MSMEVSASSPSNLADVIIEDVSCEHCGYSLKGLRIGGPCPECGTLIVGVVGAAGSKRSEPEIFGKPLIEAPDWYIRSLQLAFVLMMFAWFTTPLSIVLGWFGFRPFGSASPAVLNALFIGLWSAGVMITLQNRPLNIRGKRKGEPISERPRLRLLVALSQVPLVCIPVLGHVAGTAGSPALYVGLLLICAVGAIAGYVPTMVYLGQIADWARDEALGDKLRANGWLVGTALLGLVGIYGTITIDGIIPIFPFVIGLFWLLIVIIFLISMAFIALSTVRLWRMSHWLLINKHSLADRDRRMLEKAAREAASMAARAPEPAPHAQVDQFLYDSVIEKHEREQSEDCDPTSTPSNVKYGDETRIEKTGDNPYGLEEDNP